MKERLTKLVLDGYLASQRDGNFCADVADIANYLLTSGVIIPPTICEHCTFFEPFEKVEDFDGRCYLLNGSEVDKDFYCKWGAKK